MEQAQSTKFVFDLLRLMLSKKASDVFITAGLPPSFKIDGKMVQVSKQPLTPQHTLELVQAIMDEKQTAEFGQEWCCVLLPPRFQHLASWGCRRY
jgi:twitching motility protein PilU